MPSPRLSCCAWSGSGPTAICSSSRDAEELRRGAAEDKGSVTGSVAIIVIHKIAELAAHSGDVEMEGGWTKEGSAGNGLLRESQAQARCSKRSAAPPLWLRARLPHLLFIPLCAIQR